VLVRCPQTAAKIVVSQGIHWLGKWRNVVGLRHMPEGTHSLAPRPGPLVRLTFREKWIDGLVDVRLESHYSKNLTIQYSILKLVRVAGVAPALSKV